MNLQSLASAALLLLGAVVTPSAFAAEFGGKSCFGADHAYIHGDCSDPSFPVYYTDDDCNQLYGTPCAFGDGWYW